MNAIPLIQRVTAILWPAFIVAGIATILFTVAFDPAIIFIEHDISRLGSYTITFFVFWVFGAANAAATCYFLKPCEAVNTARERAKEEAVQVAIEAAARIATAQGSKADHSI
ncbi:hypothetical protein MNBD_GAMMA06-2026 [hydrothermal vent metagenome]|uniref:Uncharacterized protein n=1 Tax=hydrothermal vent metagenome TaxID=652676 RepID=A0A3B0WVD1_9ZZZZ